VSWLTSLFSKRALDDRLLTGELSPDTGQGKVRADQLLSARHRARSAKALRELVEEAQQPRPSFFNANLRVQRTVIREDQALILARELEERALVNPRGVILADRLITDGESPAYSTGAAIEDHGKLAHEVERARAALRAD
jgi:hypothetical protein